MGIYAYSTDKLKILYNKIAYFTFAIYLENTTNSTVNNNNIMSEFPYIGNNGIKITNTSTNAIVTNNNMCGMYKYDLIADSGINNTVSPNNIAPYYTITTERSVFNVV
jgi:nitrous oxidase accessory protein NosD